jgi:hypothetical protein
LLPRFIHRDQSSMGNPGTRPKSFALPVTTVALCSSAMAAMHRSFLPALILRCPY